MARPSQVIAGERVERASPEEESANHEEGDVEHGNDSWLWHHGVQDLIDPINDRTLPGSTV